jgi:hypothetical protein
MGQDYFSKKLEEDPEHEFLVFVHSQGGTRLNNYISKLDFVPGTSSWSYAKNVCGIDSNITFLKPATINPLKEHYLMGETYWQKIQEQGLNFKAMYLHE